jgi:hypothetical protein
MSLYCETDKMVNTQLSNLCIPKWNPTIKTKGAIITAKGNIMEYGSSLQTDGRSDTQKMFNIIEPEDVS